MGGAKRMMEDHEAKKMVAIRIAMAAGVLDTCEFHADCILEGGEEIESAYKLGNSEFTAGKLEGTFDSRLEMTDTIKEVVEENSADECYICARHRDRD